MTLGLQADPRDEPAPVVMDPAPVAAGSGYTAAGADGMPRTSWGILGVRISAAPAPAIAAECVARRPVGSALTVICANLHSLVTAASDETFAAALQGASFVTADGAPLVLAGRALGEPVGPRVTGWDLYIATMTVLDREGGGAFFLGSTPAVLERIRERVSRDFPRVRVALHSPPFGELTPDDDQAIVDRVNGFRPCVVWVGMSAPRQEKWAARVAPRLDTNAVAGIGAVFDFYAGTVPRAPVIMQRAGFEWLYRLVREPRRLWRRYLVSGPIFASLVVAEWRARGRR